MNQEINMKVTRRQLSYLIEHMLSEQTSGEEDKKNSKREYTRSVASKVEKAADFADRAGGVVVDTAEEPLVWAAGKAEMDKEAQIIIDAARKLSIGSPIETAIPATKTAFEELKDYIETPEGQRKWVAFAALMGSIPAGAKAGKIDAMKALFVGGKDILKILTASSASEAALASGLAVTTTATALAAAEAVIAGAALWKTGEAAAAVFQAIGEYFASAGRGAQKVNNYIANKLFIAGVKKAKKEGFSSKFIQKAHSQMKSLRGEASNTDLPELLIVLSFVSGAEVVSAIESLREKPKSKKDFQLVTKMDGMMPTIVLHTAGSSDFANIRVNSLLGLQYKFISLIKKSKQFAKETEEKTVALVKDFTKEFKEKELP
jgi:hypothetical protein